MEVMSKIVNTQVSFDCDEFEIFHIGNRNIITTFPNVEEKIKSLTVSVVQSI